MAKAKKTAAPHACQSREETMDAIKTLGDTQRELARLETSINDEIAAITQREKGRVDALKERIDALTTGIHWWCEANRLALCAGGGKTANLITGEVSWRQRPPSVSLRAVDKVLETLKRLGLDRFIRTKEEVNKEAILADPRSVAGVAGVTVVQGIEDFAVTPFEIDIGGA
ncbi:MAG: host-nuclease inhibitor Gam family protein [Betaproteobacteria bacterium]|nr:host-nuclease inhibitor Gam family protein [Betaproteobacteria bacterium]